MFELGIPDEHIVSLQVILGFYNFLPEPVFVVNLRTSLDGCNIAVYSGSRYYSREGSVTQCKFFNCRPTWKLFLALANCHLLSMNSFIEGHLIFGLGLKWSLSLQLTR